MPYTSKTDQARLTYRFKTDGVKTAKVHVVTKSTLDFLDKGGLVYDLSVDGQTPVNVNFNKDLNAPDNLLKDVMSGNDDVDIHDVMTAMAKAEINVNVATTVVGKIIQTYDKIMQIQV